MVAKITVPLSIKRTLNYNERKLKDGLAECLYAHNFLKDAGQLNFYEKLKRFEDLISLNKRAMTNTLHVSLNFAENEKLEHEKLQQIASAYMNKLGFGDQPYLVYQHHDAGHPHLHVVTTNIQKDGKRISLHHLAIRKSEPARKEIEKEFNLVRAEDRAKKIDEIKPILPQKLVYGKIATKRSITNVLDFVLTQYKYSSLPELNAILKLYNLKADRGVKDGVIFNKKGLLYRILDDKGNSLGVPIKASSIYNKPTLSFLEKKFVENQQLKLHFKKQLKTKLDWILIKPPLNLETFKEALERENISLVVHQNEEVVVYDLTYIDHSSKCIFNGSDIGKEYSAKSILEKCSVQHETITPLNETKVERTSTAYLQKQQLHPNEKNIDISKPVELLLSSEAQFDHIPYNLRKLKKKKRKS